MQGRNLLGAFMLVAAVTQLAQAQPSTTPLLPFPGHAISIEAGYQSFKPGEFNLAKKSVTFEWLENQAAYTVVTQEAPVLVDLEENWEIANTSIAVDLGTEFIYGETEHSVVLISTGGFLTFNDSSNPDLDCFNTSTYTEDDVIVALCSHDVLTLVRHALLDDRLVVQWAMPGDICNSSKNGNSSLTTVVPSAPAPGSSNLMISQVELLFVNSTIKMAWASNTPCQTVVGLGVAGSTPSDIVFSGATEPAVTPAPDCSDFTVNGPEKAFSCEERVAVVLPPHLPPVVLFSGKKDLEQQIVTIANVAGQAVAVTGVMPQSPQLAPSPASPIGLRHLLQADLSAPGQILPALPGDVSAPNFLSSGLALLQTLQSLVSQQSRVMGPSIAADLAALQANSTMQVAPYLAPAPGPSPSIGFLSAPAPVMGPMTQQLGDSSQLSPNARLPVLGDSSNSSSPTSTGMGRKMLQDNISGPGPMKAIVVPTGAPIPYINPAALSPAPAMGPEAISSAIVTAVGIKETVPEAAVEMLQFLPAQGCSDPRQPGPCDQYSARWYYDADEAHCAEFAFGGCLGSLNNFASQAACERACIGGANIANEPESTGLSIPSKSELVFLANALVTKLWVTLDATSDVLPAGASAALHLTYNSTMLTPGIYDQSITITTNDPSKPAVLIQPSLMLFCGRFDVNKSGPSQPNVTYTYLSGTQPQWVSNQDLDEELNHVYFEVSVIFDVPVPHLLSSQVSVEAADLAGKIISVGELGPDEGFGPMCSAWRIRGAAPLPDDYAETSEGTLLSTTITDVQDAWGEMLPTLTANKTLWNSLPQCVFYAQGMTFGGDLGLVVASSSGSARAILVCSTELYGLCSNCITPQYSNSTGNATAPTVSFFGPVPGVNAQYDVEVRWPPNRYYGELNITVGCNAMDAMERPLDTVQPLRVAIVKTPELLPPISAFAPAPGPS